MKKMYFIPVIILALAACQNKKEQDPFQIDRNQVGRLTKTIQVRQLDSLFAEDSIVKKTTPQSFGDGSEIIIYDRKGSELLILDPAHSFDSTSTISNIEIKDPRYETEKGLNAESTFKVINKNYRISRIENTLSALIIFIDDLNIYLSIDKKYISGSAKYNTDVKIEPSQIPDDAKIKHFWVGWQ